MLSFESPRGMVKPETYTIQEDEAHQESMATGATSSMLPITSKHTKPCSPRRGRRHHDTKKQRRHHANTQNTITQQCGGRTERFSCGVYTLASLSMPTGGTQQQPSTQQRGITTSTSREHYKPQSSPACGGNPHLDLSLVLFTAFFSRSAPTSRMAPCTTFMDTSADSCTRSGGSKDKKSTKGAGQPSFERCRVRTLTGLLKGNHVSRFCITDLKFNGARSRQEQSTRRQGLGTLHEQIG